MISFYLKYSYRDQYEKFGIRAVHFFPVGDRDKKLKEKYPNYIDFQGYRYFFENEKSLKRFYKFIESEE